MSGIAGIIEFGGEANAKLLEKMCLRMRHHGSTKVASVAGDSVALGYAPGIRGGQSPSVASDETGKCHLVWDGMIHNCRELGDELRGRGWSGESGADDARILLRAYMEFGTDFLLKLDGEFSVAVWDENANSLLIARDPFGAYPVYYWAEHGRFIFASKMAALLGAGIEARPRRDAILETLCYGAVLGRATVFESINSLERGHYLAFDLAGRRTRVTKYYDLLEKIDPGIYGRHAGMSDTQIVDALDSLLVDCVRKRCGAGGERVGIMCSGGTDSSLVAAMAVKLGANAKIYCANVAEKGRGEGDAALTVARQLNLEASTFEVTRESFVGQLVRLIHENAAPIVLPNFASSCNVYKTAAAESAEVILTGAGADTLFGGLWGAKCLRHDLRRKRLTDLLPRRVQSALWRAFLPPMVSMENYRLKNNILRLSEVSLGYLSRSSFRQATLSAYGFMKNDVERLLSALMVMDHREVIGPILLLHDLVNMEAGTATTAPFLDRGIIEFAANLPLKFKIRGERHKWIVRKVAERYLPAERAHRGKGGSPIPLDLWFRVDGRLFRDGFWSEFMDLSPALVESVVRKDLKLLWHFADIEIWGRMYFRGETPEQVAQLIR